MDPSRARRDLHEAQALQQRTVATTVQRRSRWTMAGLVVFGASVLDWLAGSGPVNILFLALIVLCVLATLLGRSPQRVGLLGKRVRLTRESSGEVRWLITVTLLGVLAEYFLLNTVVLILLGNPHPIAGAIVGLTLALIGPHFASWWFRRAGNRG